MCNCNSEKTFPIQKSELGNSTESKLITSEDIISGSEGLLRNVSALRLRLKSIVNRLCNRPTSPIASSGENCSPNDKPGFIEKLNKTFMKCDNEIDELFALISILEDLFNCAGSPKKDIGK